jgi:hypothetical protein
VCCHDALMGSRGVVSWEPNLRIGDAERDSCLAALTEHHMLGRLSVQELDERQRAALAAVSRADLDALLSDLPDLGGDADQRRALRPATQRAQSAKRAQRWWGPSALVLASFITQTGSSGDLWHLNQNIETGLFMATFGYAAHWAVTKVRG